jgi:two-component system chemotaxis response regulator CheB
VQDPSDAAVADMPLSALRYAAIDHVATAEALGALLARLSREPAGETPPIPPEIRLETAIAAQEGGTMEKDDKLGTPSRFTCPECHGTLWEVDDGSLLRYRCHVGHAFTAEVMLDAQTTSAEEMLWSLMRAHRERAALARRMAERARAQSHDALARDLEKRAAGYEEDASVVHEMLRAHVGAEGSSAEGSGRDAA